MKQLLLYVGALVTLSTYSLVYAKFSQKNLSNARYAISVKKANVISCVPERAVIVSDRPSSMIPLPGWGNYRWPGKTSQDSADFYFNQGMNMYYSFHILEAMASFQKAAFLAPADPMPQWGIALAYGPNINDVAYNYSPLALEAARKASNLSGSRSDFEKSLIAAMLLRYADDPSITRTELDHAYAEAMASIYRQFPGEPDAGALYADALMLQHPWDLYEQDQQPKKWTPQLVAVLENVLSRSPNHPGANHYYIHAVEASKNPERALSSADKLGILLPMVAHMVHMPSHIYIRTGMYEKGIAVNKRAIEGFEAYKTLLPSVENGSFLYLLHNRHMQAASAMNSGYLPEALLASGQLQQDIPGAYLGSAPPEAEYLQYMYMSRVFTDVRFGDWSSLINSANLPDSLIYARILQAFGKSVAYARTRNFIQSEHEIKLMMRLMNSSEKLKTRMGAFNTAFSGGEVAIAMAKGILAEEQNRLEEAVQFLEEAVKLEDRMIYNEPKDWILPPRQYLGSVLLKAGDPGRAEKAFREDLAFNPDNGWSLKGLKSALDATKKEEEARAVGARLKETTKNRNFNPNGPVF